MAKKNAGSRAGPKRRIMRTLKINEISGVDVPAQQGALAVIMKRQDGAPQTEELEKRLWLTTSVDGHAHLVDEQTYDGRFREGGDTSWTQSEGEDQGHSHPWVRDQDGKVTIGEADGHTHEVIETTMKRTFSPEEREKLAESGEALADGSFPIVTKADLKNALKAFGRAKNKAQVARHIKKRAKALGALDLLPEEGKLADLLKNDTSNDPEEIDTMATKSDDKKANELTVEQLQKQLDRATAINTLDATQKAHFDTLEGDKAQDAFLAKSTDERKAEVEALEKAATDADPVVYTTTDGVELRKSAGEAIITVAKSNDQLRKDNDELRKQREQDTLEKRAEEELPHIPGDVASRAAMLKAIDGIEDETQRETALNALKAQNEVMKGAFEVAGHGGAPAPGSAADQLDTLAKKRQEANPELTIEQAYAEVTKTAEGAELYTKTLS